MDRVYKRKKSTVQLTSLLDLLFVMIFVSLLQDKQSEAAKAQAKIQTKKQEITKPVEVKPKKTIFTINATFHFYATESNPNTPSGKYLMQGSYNKETGEIRLGGVGWLNRPENYDMVPLSGKMDKSEAIFTGRIEFIGCKQFTLSREQSYDTTPISGEWIGTYECSQGETGLTLSIK